MLQFIVLGLVPGTHIEITYGWVSALPIVVVLSLLLFDVVRFTPSIALLRFKTAKKSLLTS